jgi:hypothetical protein
LQLWPRPLDLLSIFAFSAKKKKRHKKNATSAPPKISMESCRPPKKDQDVMSWKIQGKGLKLYPPTLHKHKDLLPKTMLTNAIKTKDA